MSPKNILYAEDNPDDVVIFKLALKRASSPLMFYNVEDGSAAIAWLQGEGKFADRGKYPLPDVLILDLKMPRQTGFDVLEWVKKSGQFPNLPVIVFSSSDDPRDVTRANELGATRYFMKSAACREPIEYLQTLV